MSISEPRLLPSAGPGAPRSEHLRTFRIIYALIMHDIKSRFFGSGLGQIVMIIWPFAHIGVLLIVYTVTHRPHPYGDSLLQYSSVSVYPFICFNYVARWIGMSASQNKSFMQYPIIRPLDILLARACLETISAAIVAFLLILVLVTAGENAFPVDPSQAVFAVLATLFLAIGFGILNAPFALLTPFWALVMVVFILAAYATSGILFLPDAVPEPYRTYLSYNPVLQCTEWLRSAYFSDYPTSLIDRSYVLGFSLTCLASGLIILRLLRRFY